MALVIPKPHRLCTSILKRPSFQYTVAFLLFLCFSLYYTLHKQCPKPSPPSPQNLFSKDPLVFQKIFLNSSNNSTVSSFLQSLTVGPHLAGTPQAVNTLNYFKSQLQSYGLKTHVTEYQALLSYPTHSSLTMHFSEGKKKELYLGEKEEGTEKGKIVKPYHAYSPSGAVYGKPVFVNYGTAEDYRKLGVMGVNVSGCIVVARRGSVSRRWVVEKAAEGGALAVLLYADGDGVMDGVERGTVMRGLGDPLTPGWAAISGAQRLDGDEVEERFPRIPSMPISAGNAYQILGYLGGPLVSSVWGPTISSNPGGPSRTGPGPVLLNFTYQAEKKVATVRNAFAVIKGVQEPDRYVLLGNHRDAWTYGAVDPNSGTAALLDIARRYAALLHKGWNPRRTIILCSWDAEEFGMIGSTEWVEQNLQILGSKAVAYLNVDCAVQGPGFFARATPQLDSLLVEVTKKVKDPDSDSKTVYQTWINTNRGKIERLSGVDSDFAAFLQHSGVPAVDLYFGKDFPVYHTAFDSFEWMKKYGDPFFHRHVAVAGIWGLLVLHLADDPILPFEYLSYATQLQKHMEALTVLLDSGTSLHPINSSIQELIAAANGAKEEAKRLRERQNVELLELRLRAFNDRLMLAERGFLEPEGIKGRQWFKHLIYGPPSDCDSMLAFFPGIADAINQAKNMKRLEGQVAIQNEIWRVARAIQRAAAALTGELT